MTTRTLKTTTETISEILHSQDLPHHGFAQLKRPYSIEFYQQWIKNGMNAEMEYLATHLPLKEDPSLWKPSLKSAIMITSEYAVKGSVVDGIQGDYVTHPQPRREDGRRKLEAVRIARYARGRDYHHWLHNRLEKVAALLQQQFPGEEFLAATDSLPILERDLAREAGLGWVGKNTCLIHPKRGSLFFIGEILTSLTFAPEEISKEVTDHCGTCTRCIDACPTGAIVESRKLDARKCIAYWTIESRVAVPPPIREQIGDWLFGCDICQTVCPWNLKFLPSLANETPSVIARSEDDQAALIADLRWILSSTNNQVEKSIRGTPLHRAGPKGLKRNALLIVGNLRILELQDCVESFLPDINLSDLAKWSLHQLQGAVSART